MTSLVYWICLTRLEELYFVITDMNGLLGTSDQSGSTGFG